MEELMVVQQWVMWEADSFWVEVAIVSIILSLGNILMGHFEEVTQDLLTTKKQVFIVRSKK